jgi:hypothetical protein
MRAAAGHLQVMVGGTTEGGGPRTRVTSGMDRAAGAAHSGGAAQSLQALQSAVARKTAPQPGSLVASARPDRAALPLDEDFKDF